jgi:CTP:molybdopterin cytidylyltransferase MocA
MGGIKQLKTWRSAAGDKPLIAAAYDAIRPICDEVVVVLGHEAKAVAAALDDRPFRRTTADPDAPMFESIRAGLIAAQSIDALASVILHPGDHPEVARSTLQLLTDWSLQRPVNAIIPEHADRGGHPILIPPTVAAIILSAICPAGLGQFWLDHPELCHRLPVDDFSMLKDVDTPADLN